MFSIAICDDEPEICTGIKHTLSQHGDVSQISVSGFYAGEELCESIRSGVSYGLIILDIELKATNRVAVGKLLREEQQESVTQILYISVKQEYAMELFDLCPPNFLIKPLEPEKLLRCVDEAMEYVSQNPPCFAFTAQRAVYRIPYREIRHGSFKGYHVVPAQKSSAEVVFTLGDADGLVDICKVLELGQRGYEVVALSAYKGARSPVLRAGNRWHFWGNL